MGDRVGQVHRPSKARGLQAKSGQVGRTGLAQGKTRGQGQGDIGVGGWQGENKEGEIRKGCQHLKGELEGRFDIQKVRGSCYTHRSSLPTPCLARVCLVLEKHFLTAYSGF